MRGPRHGYGIEGRGRIFPQGTRAAGESRVQVAAGGESDAFEVQRHRTLQSGVDVFLRFLKRQRGVAGVGLEVGHVALELAYSLLVLGSLSLRRLRLCGRVGGRCLGLLGHLIFAMQLVRQRLNLLLLHGQGVFK